MAKLGSSFAEGVRILSGNIDPFMTKKINTPDVATDESTEQLLWDCLKEIPFVQILKVEQRIIPDAGRPEIVARIKIGEREKLILAEVKPNGQTRLVREAIDSILAYRETYAY